MSNFSPFDIHPSKKTELIRSEEASNDKTE